MSESTQPEFLEDREFTEEEFDRLLTSVEAISMKGSGLARLLEAATFEGRLERYSEQLSSMLDVSESKALELLSGVDNHLQWQAEPGLTGMDAVWVEGGPAVRNCIRGFVRLKASHSFPEHAHLGQETTLVLQGRLKLDDGRVFGPGDVYVAEADAVHSLEALEGPDLLYFVVVHQGIRIGSTEILHRDAL